MAKRAVYPGALSLADLLGLGQRFAVALICAVPHSALRATEQAAAAAAFAGDAITGGECERVCCPQIPSNPWSSIAIVREEKATGNQHVAS